MRKTIAKDYFDTLAQAQRAKPRSERKAVMTGKVKDLMTQCLQHYNRRSAKKNRAA